MKFIAIVLFCFCVCLFVFVLYTECNVKFAAFKFCILNWDEKKKLIFIFIFFLCFIIIKWPFRLWIRKIWIKFQFVLVCFVLKNIYSILNIEKTGKRRKIFFFTLQILPFFWNIYSILNTKWYNVVYRNDEIQSW